MKKHIVLVLFISLCLLCLAACGSDGGQDGLKGKWTCKDYNSNDKTDLTFTFDGKGGVKYDSYFFKTSGAYTIEGDRIEIDLAEMWIYKRAYTFKLDDKKLALTALGVVGTPVPDASDIYCVSYELTRK